jgi:membrane protein CcdC involved in cytochrome C biogenesis
MPPVVGLLALLGAIAILVFRWQEGLRPITTRSLLLPPLGMSTGLLMFWWPPTRVPPHWAALGLALGAGLLAIPLLLSSPLENREGKVFMQRSPYFMLIVLSLMSLRFLLRHWLGAYLSWPQTGAIFYLIALGMMWRWRLTLWFKYRRLVT